MQKLVRDLIPNIIKEQGKVPTTRILSDEEFKKELDKKLLEEVQEYLSDQNIEEIADVMEVIYTLIDIHGWTFEDVEKVRKEKAQNRGSFKEKIFLESIENGREN